MAEVLLSIGDRQHRIACKDGSEAQLRRMGAMIDQRWAAANQASGGNNAERSMLFVALMLADALDEQQQAAASAITVAPAGDDPVLDRIATRLEALAATLELDAPNA